MKSLTKRGTKRTCQNEECGERFYDLNSDPINCPICQTEYLTIPLTSEMQYRPVIEKQKVKPELKTESNDVETNVEPEDTDSVLELDDDDNDATDVIKSTPVVSDKN